MNPSDKFPFLGCDLDSSRVVSDGKVILTLYRLALELMEADLEQVRVGGDRGT